MCRVGRLPGRRRTPRFPTPEVGGSGVFLFLPGPAQSGKGCRGPGEGQCHAVPPGIPLRRLPGSDPRCGKARCTEGVQEWTRPVLCCGQPLQAVELDQSLLAMPSRRRAARSPRCG